MKIGLWIIVSFIILMIGLVIYNQMYFRQAKLKFPPTGKFVTVDGIRLHYHDLGEGQPVVLLHGGVLWGEDFQQVMELAADQGFRVLAFDRPGYGYSDRPPRSSSELSPFMQARLLHAALEQLDVHKPILVGHSWSGLLVLIYAHQYPDHVAGLVTLAGGMYKEGYPASGGDPISRLVTTPVVGEIALNTLSATLGRFMTRGVLRETFAPDPVPEEYGEAATLLWLRPSQFRANREDVLDFAPAAELISRHYATIQTPTTIVMGAQDPFPTKVHSVWLHQALPNSELVELQDAAHMIPQTHPADVVRAIQSLGDQISESAEELNGQNPLSGIGRLR